MRIDCHTHTHNSPDADPNSVLERCSAALDAGLSVMAVTDHCEVNRFFSLAHYGERHSEYDTYDFGAAFEASMQENTAAKEQCPSGLTLVCGIELGQAILDLPMANHIVSDKRLDFVIGSIHQLENHEDFAFLDYNSLDVNELLHRNFAAIQALAQTDTYDVIGHITYALRYIANAGIQVDMAPFRDEIAEIFKTIIAKDKGIEVNTSGLRQSYGDCFPTLEYLKLYHDLGGDILTVGSDAHTNADLGSGIDAGLDMARAAGFQCVCYFENRAPRFVPL